MPKDKSPWRAGERCGIVDAVARAPRILEPGGIYHVGSRGNNRETVFYDDHDRRAFVAMLDRVARRHRWTGLAWCLMSNHYHLVLQVEEGGLSEGMQELNSGYARRTNTRYGRTGHLFRNRFYAEFHDTEAHFLELCRYVVLNPVRARICRAPGEWPWSSYQACAGGALATAFLRVDAVLAFFGQVPATARREYCSFVSAGHVPVSDTGLRM